MASRTLWWIHHPGGSRLRLGAGGVLVGREADCDIVLRDPGASRRQALLYLSHEGPRVIPLGRGQTRMHGAVIDAPASLLPGDAIEFPGCELRVEAEEEELTAEGNRWMLERAGGGLFGVGPQGFVIGGGASDDLQIRDWPERALAFHVAQGRLVVELGAEATISGEDVAEGDVAPLVAGSKVRIGETEIRVLIGGGDGAQTTAGFAGKVEDLEPLPTSVVLQFLPRGGRLKVLVEGREYSTYLADRRCDLVACLLQPPPPYEAGEYIPDHVLVSRVWPRRETGRTNLNVLLHRLRKDLLRAGLDGTSLVTRAEGGGATRFSVADDAEVVVV